MKTIFPNGINLDDVQTALLLDGTFDIEKWVNDALIGKINHCQQQFIHYWMPILQNDPNITSIPARIDEFVKYVISRPDYKSRAARANPEGN
jgi:hypothetical protein